MIDLLKGMKEELEKAAYKIHGQNVKARPEVSPQRKPLAEAHALFFKGLKEMKGDESKERTFMETPNFLLRDERSRSQITREGEGRARKNVGLLTSQWCQRSVQTSVTLFLKQW